MSVGDASMCSIRLSFVGLAAALLTSCGPPEGARELVPAIDRVEPAVAYSQSETRVVVYGNLPTIGGLSSSEDMDEQQGEARYRAWLGDVELLDVKRIDETCASAIVPAGLTPNSYALSLESPFHMRATQSEAFTVLPGVGPLLRARASVSPPRIGIGKQATLTLVVENRGTSDVRALTPVIVVHGGATDLGEMSRDPAPQDVSAGGAANFAWTFTGVAAGQAVFAIEGSGTDATAGRTVAMRRASTSITVQTPPDLVATASVQPATASVGQPVTVTAVVRNDGLATASAVGAEASSSFDALGDPVVRPEVQDIAGGESATFIWTYRPLAQTPATGVSLTISASGVDANTGEPVAAPAVTTNVLLVNPPAQVNATVEAPARVTAGQQIAVTLTMTNSGWASADVTPILDDPDIAGTAIVIAVAGTTPSPVRIPGSGTQSFGWVFTSSGSGTVSFTVRAAWRDVNSGAVGTASTAPALVQVLRPASLAISEVRAAPASVIVGGTVTVTAVVANAGESTAVSVAPTAYATGWGFSQLTAPLPQDVPGGLTRTFTWTYSVEPGATGGTFSIRAAGEDENTLEPLAAPPATANSVVVVHVVGGTVSGLAGAGLLLRNGSEFLSVTAGAKSFTFPTLVASGSRYAVTVVAHPVDPTQTCIVANGTGTAGGVDMPSLRVTCTTCGLADGSEAEAGVTITNLSGDLTSGGNWSTPHAAQVTLTALTPAQFLAEQPTATIPVGHVAAYGILKFEITAPGSSWVVADGRNLPSTPAFASLHNITPRWYLPPSMRERFETIASDQRIRTEFIADAYPARTNYYATWIRAGASSVGAFHTVYVPAAATGVPGLGNHLSKVQAVSGSPAAGNLNWFRNRVMGDAAAAPGNPLIVYLFDIVQIAEAKPTLYFRWDDGSANHREVSRHMRNGTRFGGGGLARPLPSTFAIIPTLIDVPTSVSRQDLREMAAEGSEITVHGYGSGGRTWGAPMTDAQVTAEIDAIREIIAAEGWPRSWRDSVVYPGNNFYASTAEGTAVADLVASLGLRFGVAGTFGYGFSFRAMTSDAMFSTAIATLGLDPLTSVASAAGAEELMDFMDKSRLSLVLMGHVVGDGGITESTFDAVMGAFAAELVLANARIRTASLIGSAVREGFLTN